MHKHLLTLIVINLLLFTTNVFALDKEVCTEIKNTCPGGQWETRNIPVPGRPGITLSVQLPCWQEHHEFNCVTTKLVDSCEEGGTDVSACDLYGTNVTRTTPTNEKLEWDDYYLCSDDFDEKTYLTDDNLKKPVDISSFQCAQTDERTIVGHKIKTIGKAPVERDWWLKEVDNKCFTGKVTESCSIECPEPFQPSIANANFTIVDRDEDLDIVKTKVRDVACSANENIQGCNDANIENCPSEVQYIPISCKETNSEGVCVSHDYYAICEDGTDGRGCEVDEGCTFKSETCVEDDCSTVKRIYECQKSVDTCLNERQELVCKNDFAQGLDVEVDDPPSQELGKVMGAMQMVDMIGKDAMAAGLNGNLTVFNGKQAECDHPRYGKKWLTNDCCEERVRDEGSHYFGKCNFEEISLAAARRANRAKFVADRCVESAPLLGCIRNEQLYCQFDSTLAKVIQEEGRKQLEDLLANGTFGNVVNTTVNFTQYTAEGGWYDAGAPNNNQLRIWQWPGQCAEGSLETLNSGFMCPGYPDLYFAVCSKPEGCGALPIDPRMGSGTWGVFPISTPWEEKTQAVSRYMVATGKCNEDGACSYKIAAWPAGIGGQAQVQAVLKWKFNETQETPIAIGQYQFKPLKLSPAPNEVKMKMSDDGGNSWTYVSWPLVVQQNDFQLNSSTTKPITLFGSCDLEGSGYCEFNVIITAQIRQRPWVKYKTIEVPQETYGTGTDADGNPIMNQSYTVLDGIDCDGFSVEELASLDFSKMDLSEWLAAEDFNIPDGSDLANRATDDLQRMQNLYTTGKPGTLTPPVPEKFFFISPTDGVGPLAVTLRAGSNWPKPANPDDPSTSDPVSSITIDWGDGSSQVLSSKTNEGIFQATHTFPEQPQSTTEARRYKIIGTINASSGVHAADAKVAVYSARTTMDSDQNKQGGGDAKDQYQLDIYSDPSGKDGRGALDMNNLYNKSGQ